MRSLLCLTLVSMLGCGKNGHNEELEELKIEVEALKAIQSGQKSSAHRAVVEIYFNAAGEQCTDGRLGGEVLNNCICPEGFSHVGYNRTVEGTLYNRETWRMVCLED